MPPAKVTTILTWVAFAYLRVDPLLALLLTLPVAFLFGMAVQKLLLDAVVGAPELTGLLITFGLGLTMIYTAELIFTTDFRTIPYAPGTVRLTSTIAVVLSSASFLIYDLVSFRNLLRQDLTTQAEIVAYNSAAALAFKERGTIARLAALAGGDAPFEEVVFAAVNTERPADGAGAIAGALAGARHGAGGIPQALIDGLEARVYLSLAAPWFYKTAARRAGTLIDLRQV